MSTSDGLRRSPLYELYPEGTPFMEFGGWEMPRDFGGIVREHQAVRDSVGVFDLSHMGRLVIRGPGAAQQLSGLFTRDLTDADPRRALYGFFCDEEGGCLDDDILYLRSPEEVWGVVNASNRIRIYDWLTEQLDATVEDRTLDTVLLAVQGPEAPDAIGSLGISPFPDRPFRCIWDNGSLFATTGYTGEAGGELWLPDREGSELFRRIRDQDLVLCGLGARDTLRLEKAYPLHGHELSREIDPLTAGMERFIDWDHEFIGRESLLEIRKRGPDKRLTGVVLEGRRSPRRGYAVRVPDGPSVGTVTSGRYSPSLEKGIGLALVDPSVPRERDLEVEIRDQWYRVEQDELPFL